jgi:hypothetical protein
MMSRRTLEGALKCALRDLRLEDETFERTLTIVIDVVDGGQGVE